MSEKLKILVAEDDKNVAALYELGLAGEEFETRIAYDGSEALEAYLAWQPDIVVLDIMLPEMSGYSILKEIRQAHEDKGTTVIMVTSKSAKEDVLDCLRLGIQGYIVKPFRHTEIKAKIMDCRHKHMESRS